MELLPDNHVDSHELAAVYVLSNAWYPGWFAASALAVISNPVLDDQLLSETIVDASVKYGFFVAVWVVVVFLNIYAEPLSVPPVSSRRAPTNA